MRRITDDLYRREGPQTQAGSTEPQRKTVTDAVGPSFAYAPPKSTFSGLQVSASSCMVSHNVAVSLEPFADLVVLGNMCAY